MFDMKKPCKDCPFTRGNGGRFGLPRERIEEIFGATAFQCHKTLASDEEGDTCAGTKPQQCVGLMGVHIKQGSRNAIMQVAERLGGFDLSHLQIDGSYASMSETILAHGEKSQ